MSPLPGWLRRRALGEKGAGRTPDGPAGARTSGTRTRVGGYPVPPEVAARRRVIGYADAGPRDLIGPGLAASRHHFHVPGPTGTGKSTLLGNLVLQDAVAGRGVVLLDPKGDLVRDLLDRLPASLAGRLVLIDPDEHNAPPTLNVLADNAEPATSTHPRPERVDPVGEAARYRATDDLVAIFHRLFRAWWGHRTDDILRCACLTLTARPGVTLADVPRLLADPAYRAPYVKAASARDGFLRDFWAWYEALTDAGRATATGPVPSKLRAVLGRPFVRRIFGAPASTFTLTDVLDHGGILLARLPKGVLGQDTARLVGSILVAKTWEAALGRAGRREPDRPDCTLYVDECHNFLNLASPIEDMLAEARGYHLSVVLAHQYLGQLGTELAHGISANAHNKICFRLDPDDATRLARHYTPAMSADDLARLGPHQVACRVLDDHGRPVPAFTALALPPADPIPGRAEMLRQSSRDTYGLPLEQHRAHRLRQDNTPAAPAPAPSVPDVPAASSRHSARPSTRQPARHLERRIQWREPESAEPLMNNGFHESGKDSDSWDEP